MVKDASTILGPDAFQPRRLPLRLLEHPHGGEVHLWHLDFNTLSNPLHPDDPGDAPDLSVVQQRAVRHFYLRLLLGAYLGLPGKDVHITRRIKGRPELGSAEARAKINFSVSRSAGCYLIGISSGAAIGVDLEVAGRRGRNPLALARRYMSEAETTALSALSGERLQRAFMHTWSCNEAIVKANGTGIANQLYRFSVDVNPDNPPAVLSMLDDDPAAWKMAMARPTEDAIAAVAVRQKSVTLKGFRLV